MPANEELPWLNCRHPWANTCLLMSCLVGFLDRPCTYIVSCLFSFPDGFLGLTLDLSCHSILSRTAYRSCLSPLCPGASWGMILSCPALSCPCHTYSQLPAHPAPWISWPLGAPWHTHCRYPSKTVKIRLIFLALPYTHVCISTQILLCVSAARKIHRTMWLHKRTNFHMWVEWKED